VERAGEDDRERRVDLGLSDEQSALVDVFSSIADRFSSAEAVRAYESLGFSPDLWEQLVAAGAPGIALSADVGGGGAGLLEVALVLEALGRRLAPAPLVEPTAAARMLEQLGELPAGVADGTTIATVALRPPVERVARLVPAGAVAPVVVVRSDDDLLVVRSEPPDRAVPNLACSPLAHRAI